MELSLLLLLLLLSAGVHQGSAEPAQIPKEWPCPNDADIMPCVCTFDSSNNLFMDCSDVTSSDQLAQVFATSFPFTRFVRLTISPVTANPGLTDLPIGVFGDVTFEEVYIRNTLIATIHEEVFVNSHPYLRILNLADNEISIFPIETLDLFTQILEFDISNNNLPTDIPLPDIVSDTLQFINLGGNNGVILSANTFVAAPALEDVRLNNMGLGLTSNVFDMFIGLSSLRNLELANNQYSGRLIQYFINPTSTSLTTVLLADNQLSDIHPEAITGLGSAAYVDFQNNDLECLLQEEWKPLLDQVDGPEVIDLRGNPLVCGCDVFWLVDDPAYLNKIHSNTMCDAGVLLYDLDSGFFLSQCPAGPDGPPEGACANRPPYY